MFCLSLCAQLFHLQCLESDNWDSWCLPHSCSFSPTPSLLWVYRYYSKKNIHVSPSFDEQIFVTKHALQHQIYDEAPTKSGLNVRVMIIESTIYFLNEYLGLRQLLTIESRGVDKSWGRSPNILKHEYVSCVCFKIHT